MAYKKCPRCSLNYIQDQDLLCRICLDEVDKALRSDGDDEEDYDICPECGDHIIKSGEEMCYQCMMEQVKDETEKDNGLKGEDWDSFDDDVDDTLVSDDDDETDEELKQIELDMDEEELLEEEDLDPDNEE